MLPTLGLLAAAIGLLTIILLVYREQRRETASAERNMLIAVSVVTAVVAAWHIIGPGAGSH